MPAAGETLANLNFFWQFDSEANPEYIFGLSTGDDTPVLQANLDAISTGKNLESKMAGEDYELTSFDGWNLAINADGTVPTTPNELMQAFFGLIDGMAADRANGTTLTDPLGNTIESVYLNDAGHDLKQLVQKFAFGGVTLSQGLGDYLFNITGKDNIEPYKGTKNHTAMEHNWDEAYGYFGAARNYSEYTDDEIAGKGGRDEFQGFNDTDGDGFIDLAAEYNFGNSVNAATRDRGSSTDFTAGAFSAWTRGRALIHTHVGMNFADWSADAQADFEAQIVAVQASWEGAVAATVVHYINGVLADMATFNTDDYSYADHAKHWGELKGFALGLQFNPWSPLHEVLPEYCYDMSTHSVTEGVSEVDCADISGIHTPESTGFVRLHNKIGDAPVLPNNEGGMAAIMGYQGALGAAKTVLTNAFGFSHDDVANW